MAILLGLGVAITLVGIAMDADAVRLYLIQNLTSRSLGSLAPGFAATTAGYRIYTGLVRAFGLAITGVALADFVPWAAALAVLGVAFFIFNSVRVIRGEIRTYRALRR